MVVLWGNISLKYGFYTISFSFFMDVNIYNIVNSVLGVEGEFTQFVIRLVKDYFAGQLVDI